MHLFSTVSLQQLLYKSPSRLRYIALVFYFLVSAVSFLVHMNHSSHDHLSTNHTILLALTGISMVWLLVRKKPVTFDWIITVGILPSVCCALSFYNCREISPAYIGILSTPAIWTALLFPPVVIIVSWVSVIFTFAFVASMSGVDMLTLIENSTLFALTSGLLTFFIYHLSTYLREMISRIRSVYDTLSEGVILQDLSGIIIDCNKSAVSILGIPKHLLIGQQLNNSSWTLYQENGVAFPPKTKFFASSGNTISDVGNQLIGLQNKNEPIKWIRYTLQPVETPFGAPRSVVVSFNDVTGQIMTTAILRESEVRFRQLTELFPATIFETDKDGYITYVNSSGLRRFNADDDYQKHHLNLLTFVHPEDRSIVKDKLGERMLGKELGYSEFRALPLQGEFFHALAYNSPIIKDGVFAGFRGCIIDIHERKLVEQQLRENEMVLKLLLENISAGILIIDASTRMIEKVNPAALDILQRTEQEVLGNICHCFICPAEAGKCPLLDCGMDIDHSERKLLKSDGTKADILKSVKKIMIEGKVKLLETFIDISSQKELESRLLQANRELEDASTQARQLLAKAEMAALAKSSFLANMSHEIRTPLNGIIGINQLLLETSLTDEQRNLAGIIATSGQSLISIITDVLDYSKIEAGKMVLDETPFNIKLLCEELLQIFVFKIKEKGLSYSFDFPETIPVTLIGDSARLRQILINLIGNAVKFTEKGGITLSVILLNRDDTHCTIRFSVKDTGIGIARDKRHLVFRVFSQVDSSISRDFGGTGLGLAISQQLAEMMQGTLDFTSELHVGSTFELTIPLKIVETTPALHDDKSLHLAISQGTFPQLPSISPLDIRQCPDNNNKASILLVDDNDVNRLVAERILTKNNFCVSQVIHGLDAINTLSVNTYDLVLMDIQMPIMDGFEATRIIRDPSSSVLNHKIPVIAMTAHAGPEDYQKCIQSGMNDYISKPISPGLFLSTIGKWLPATSLVNTTYTDSTTKSNSDVFLDMKDLLERTGDDRPLAERVLRMFLEQLDKQIIDLKQATEQKDQQIIERIAHTIKGAASNSGALRLSACAKEIEHFAVHSSHEALLLHLPLLYACIDETCQVINKSLNSTTHK